MNLKIDKSKWTTVRLGDVASEYSKRVNNPSESGFDRFVGNSNIGQWDFRIKSWESTTSVTSAMKLFEPNDYLLVRRSLYASDFRERAPRADFAGVCSGDILTIRENPKFIADGFLVGVLNSPALWKFVVANASGSITRRIKWKDLANYEFLLPPKEQQAEIAQLLWSAEDMVKNKHNCIDQLDTLIASSLKEQYLDNYENLTSLGDAGKWVSGGTPSKQNKLFWEGDIPWVSAKDMKVEFIESSIDKITPLAVEKGAGLLPEKSLLVVVRGMILAHSFPVALNKVPVAFNQDMRALLISGDFIPEYLLFYLQFAKDKVLSITTTTTHGTRRLASEELHSIEVPKPTIEKQQAFVDVVMNKKHTRQLLVDSVKSSKALQKSLIHQVF